MLCFQQRTVDRKKHTHAFGEHTHHGARYVTPFAGYLGLCFCWSPHRLRCHPSVTAVPTVNVACLVAPDL